MNAITSAGRPPCRPSDTSASRTATGPRRTLRPASLRSGPARRATTAPAATAASPGRRASSGSVPDASEASVDDPRAAASTCRGDRCKRNAGRARAPGRAGPTRRRSARRRPGGRSLRPRARAEARPRPASRASGGAPPTRRLRPRGRHMRSHAAAIAAPAATPSPVTHAASTAAWSRTCQTRAPCRASRANSARESRRRPPAASTTNPTRSVAAAPPTSSSRRAATCAELWASSSAVSGAPSPNAPPARSSSCEAALSRRRSAGTSQSWIACVRIGAVQPYRRKMAENTGSVESSRTLPAISTGGVAVWPCAAALSVVRSNGSEPEARPTTTSRTPVSATAATRSPPAWMTSHLCGTHSRGRRPASR